jgi:hypothetical protein
MLTQNLSNLLTDFYPKKAFKKIRINFQLAVTGDGIGIQQSVDNRCKTV